MNDDQIKLVNKLQKEKDDRKMNALRENIKSSRLQTKIDTLIVCSRMMVPFGMALNPNLSEEFITKTIKDQSQRFEETAKKYLDDEL